MRAVQESLRIFLALWVAVAPVKAWAGSMTLLGVGSAGPVGTPFSIEGGSGSFQTTTTTNSAQSPSFPGLSIGTDEPTRIVLAFVCDGPNTIAISGLTIGGVSATQVPGARKNSGAGAECDAWYASGVTGATATVTWGTGWASQTRIVVTMYAIHGTGSSFSVAGGNNTTSGSSLSAAVSIPAGGGAIAVAMTHSNSSGSGTPTNLTLDTNGLVAGTSTNYAGRNTSSSGSTTMGVAWTGSTDAALSIVAFNP